MRLFAVLVYRKQRCDQPTKGSPCSDYTFPRAMFAVAAAGRQLPEEQARSSEQWEEKVVFGMEAEVEAESMALLFVCQSIAERHSRDPVENPNYPTLLTHIDG